MRMPFCRVIRLLQWVDYAFLCRLFEWGRISRNWHVKKFLPCQEKMIWAWLVCLNKSEIYVFEVQPTSHENGPDDDRVTFDFICNIKICINMDYDLSREQASKSSKNGLCYWLLEISGNLQSSMITFICFCTQNVHVMYFSNSILIYRQRHTSNGININSFVGNAAGKQNKLKHAMGQWPFFIQC